MIRNIIKKQVAIVECEALRRTCRFAARYHKANGRLERVKGWNDLAYKGDVLLAKIKES